MTVWDDLVGQDRVQEQLGAAARDADALVTAHSAGESVPPGSKMTHAWLFTGPRAPAVPPPPGPSPPPSSAPAPTEPWAEHPAAASATAATPASSVRTPT